MSGEISQLDSVIKRDDDYGSDWLYHGLNAIFKNICFPLAFDFTVYGAENLPETGGVIMASNHQSFLDPMLLGAAARRPISFMARKTLFDNPFFGKLITALHAFPIDRGGADKAAMKVMLAKLEARKVVIMFPEGTRTHDGSIIPLQVGMAMFAVKGNAPIVPTVIDGAYEAWPRNKKCFSFKSISIGLGKPVNAEDFAHLGKKKDIYKGITDEVYRQMLDIQKILRCKRRENNCE